ncbi:ABC transporter ATP-binding protein [Chromohalobacter sarecensis]|uniref:ABC transporter ATP-binding protein n=1 Tax=Chromohalobacter sarecensis TaxID=245294 RepID=A0ABV9D203_9GAMM|nr:ABC transporter ATP-binding protein [Chromohalobacter sarecensis]MCK0715200.1 ABC transporter ATP-binding protein [Chromohalobacter sarecensis]
MNVSSSTHDAPVLTVRGVRLGFANDVVLDDIDLEVVPREFVAIVGASGVGKSTLLRAFAGLLTPQRGDVQLSTADAPASRAWSMVFQAPRLFPWRRVRANIELGLEGLGLSRSERRARALEPLALVGLEELAERWPRTLSGGQQQRVGIARALAVKPRVLFMDEPFSALDALTRQRLQSELTELRQRSDAAIIFVTHDIEEAVLLADRVVVLATPGNGEPARVRDIVAIDLPLAQRREQSGFRDHVQRLERHIGVATTPEEETP